jgi:hypothetical protein
VRTNKLILFRLVKNKCREKQLTRNCCKLSLVFCAINCPDIEHEGKVAELPMLTPPGGNIVPRPTDPMFDTAAKPKPGNPGLGNDIVLFRPISIPAVVLVGSKGRSLGLGKLPKTGKPAVAETACC